MNPPDLATLPPTASESTVAHVVPTAARTAIGATVAGVALGGAYARWLGPRHARWGATDEEVAADLPGDDLVPAPSAQTTRGITIAAPPDRVWPWLVQLGADRGGFYTYDLLEDAFGLEIHSAERIVEKWQHLAVGDVVKASRNRGGGWYVAELRPNEALVLQVADLERGRPVRRTDAGGWEFLWTFALRPHPVGSRLLVRERVAFGNRRVELAMAPVGVVSFVMTRRMMLGIKERAERS